MKKPNSIAWILVLLLSAGAFAQGDAAAALADTSLVFKFKPGDVTRYKHSATVEMRSATLPDGKAVVTEEYIETSKVLSVRADGGAELKTVMSSFVQKANGEKTPVTRSMLSGLTPDTPMIYQVARNGRVLDGRVEGELSLADKIKTEAALRDMKDHGLRLPEGSLRMGESWKNEEIISNKIPGMGTMDTKLTTTYTLSSREDVLGFPCVKILAAGSGSGSLGDGRASHELKVKGTLWFAPGKGDMIRMVTEHADTMKVTGPNGPLQMDTTAVVTTEMIP